MIRLEHKWLVNKQQNGPGVPTSYWAEPNWWNDEGSGMARTYTAGGLHIRQGGYQMNRVNESPPASALAIKR
jgi:hypothetical protein